MLRHAPGRVRAACRAGVRPPEAPLQAGGRHLGDQAGGHGQGGHAQGFSHAEGLHGKQVVHQQPPPAGLWLLWCRAASPDRLLACTTL